MQNQQDRFPATIIYHPFSLCPFSRYSQHESYLVSNIYIFQSAGGRKPANLPPRLRKGGYIRPKANMDISINTPLLCGWVVHSQINHSGKMALALLASLEAVKMSPKIVD